MKIGKLKHKWKYMLSGLSKATRRAPIHTCIGDKEKTRKNVGTLLNEAGDLVTQDTEKAEVLNAFSACLY